MVGEHHLETLLYPCVQFLKLGSRSLGLLMPTFNKCRRPYTTAGGRSFRPFFFIAASAFAPDGEEVEWGEIEDMLVSWKQLPTSGRKGNGRTESPY